MSDVAAASGPQPAESFLLGLQQGLMQHPQLYILESLLVLVAAYAAAAWPDRPRGWCLSRLVTVRCAEIGSGRKCSVQQHSPSQAFAWYHMP